MPAVPDGKLLQFNLLRFTAVVNSCYMVSGVGGTFCRVKCIFKNDSFFRSTAENIAHHLKRLVRETRVAEKPYRNTVRYYPPVIQTAEEDTLNAVTSKEKPAIILEALGKDALTMSELLEKTGLSVSSLRWHLARMEEDGVIVSEKSGKLVRYSVRR